MKKISKSTLSQLRSLNVSEDLSVNYTIESNADDMNFLEKSGCLMITEVNGDNYTFVFTYQGLEFAQNKFKDVVKERKKFNSGWLVFPSIVVFVAVSFVIGYMSLNGMF